MAQPYTFRVWRGDAKGGALTDYQVQVQEGMVVLDVIHLIQATQAGDLAWLELVALLFVAALALTSLGFAFAWRTDSSQGFHAIMNLVLLPLWLLSGAFFPPPAWSAASGPAQQLLHVAMRINPLSYAVGGVRQLLSPGLEYSGSWVPGLTWCWIVTLAFAVVSYTAAVTISRQRTTGDLL